MTTDATTTTSESARPLLVLSSIGYLVALALLVWWPQPDAPSAAVNGVVEALHRVGLGAVTGVPVEFGLNVVAFVPLGLIGTFLLNRPGVLRWLVVGCAVSALIELFQEVALPDRSASLQDVVANTLGAGVGAAVALLALRALDAPNAPSRSDRQAV